jgi:octaprenyl-diphosphate synthase
MPEFAVQPTSTGSMTLAEVLTLVESELAEVERRLAGIERSDVPMTAEIQNHVLAMRGKRVRPLLLLLVSRLGRPSRDAVLWAATVIELIHTATLLHDDCLDGTSLRRGFPTVSHKWGQQAAILMGDYLFTKGFELLCHHGLHHVLHVLTFHTHGMTRGMNREYAGRFHAKLSVEEYCKIVEEKTGSLFVASCEIGSVLAGLSETAGMTFSSFGRDLGCAFQIVDDIFDFTGNPSEIGKPVGTDFRTGFATLPLIYAFKDGAPEAASRVAELFSRGNATDEEWESAQSFVLESGGVERARAKALEYAYSARDRLAVLNGTEGVAPLFATVEYMIARGH